MCSISWNTPDTPLAIRHCPVSRVLFAESLCWSIMLRQVANKMVMIKSPGPYDRANRYSTLFDRTVFLYFPVGDILFPVLNNHIEWYDNNHQIVNQVLKIIMDFGMFPTMSKKPKACATLQAFTKDCTDSFHR